jgi:hypothetical protein
MEDNAESFQSKDTTGHAFKEQHDTEEHYAENQNQSFLAPTVLDLPSGSYATDRKGRFPLDLNG